MEMDRKKKKGVIFVKHMCWEFCEIEISCDGDLCEIVYKCQKGSPASENTYCVF